MVTRLRAVLVAAFVSAVCGQAGADVRPNPLFQENAVLQQGAAVPVWGSASDGEQITVTFQDQSASTTARDGKWMIRLKPLKAGGPFTMLIAGTNKIEIKNVLVGEVWVCSGQSNMAFRLNKASNASAAIAASNDQKLRLFTVDLAATDAPRTEVKGGWAECGPDTAGDFSAVAYFFGRDLRTALKVPVGLIHASWGGSSAQAWTPIAAMRPNDVARPMLSETPGTNTPQRRPRALYNGMIAPLQPYAMRGVIWYQGEANANDPIRYRTIFPALIRGWRVAWGQGEFPFLFVQLPPFAREIMALPELREAQLLTSQTVPKTAMAVIMDYGDPGNIHPANKQPVGERLALAARGVAYGEKLIHSGPVYKSMTVKGGRAILSFTSIGGGLVARGGDLTGWEIAGQDGKFVEARAVFEGNRVVVSSPLVTQPKAVRYGWSNCPAVNLYNKEGLPASPFRTDGLTSH